MIFNVKTYKFYQFLSSFPDKFKYFQYNRDDDNYQRGEFGTIPHEEILNRYKKNPNRFVKYNWVSDDGIILYPTYIQNKYGYRTTLPYKDMTCIALGCSDTFGIGNHLEHTWPHLLGNSIKKDIINLGIPGGSMDSIYRTLKSYLMDYTPKFVFILLPSAFRAEYILNTGTEERSIQIGPNFHKSYDSKKISTSVEQIFQLIHSSEDNSYLNFYKNLEAIRYLCKESNSKLIEVLNPSPYNQDDIMTKNNISLETCFSFDINHFGPELQEVICNEFLTKL